MCRLRLSPPRISGDFACLPSHPVRVSALCLALFGMCLFGTAFLHRFVDSWQLLVSSRCCHCWCCWNAENMQTQLNTLCMCAFVRLLTYRLASREESHQERS